MRLLVNSPHPEDGTSLYRSWGALGSIRKEGLELINPPPRISWVEMENVDAVFLQRPFIPYQVELCHLARSMKKPIWIDYDDDLLAVPRDNPTSGTYNSTQSLNNVKEITKMANIVTVSTEALRAKYSEYNPNIHVVPNGLNMNILHRIDTNVARNKVIVWRGSWSHNMDLWTHTAAIREAYEKFPDWSWCFFGFDPWWITADWSPNRYRHIPFDNIYTNFIGNLQKMRGAVHIVPLSDSPFNRAKSRISHLEASLAGSAVLTPDWEEWQDGGNVRYNGVQGFRDMFFQMLDAPVELHAKTNDEDWKWVSENRTLEQTNKLRKSIITRLQGGI